MKNLLIVIDEKLLLALVGSEEVLFLFLKLLIATVKLLLDGFLA
jgi:hypothetical protein